MSFIPVIARTNDAGAPLFRCPSCAATSDTYPFEVDAARGMMSCRAIVPERTPGFHSLPHIEKTQNFIITYV